MTNYLHLSVIFCFICLLASCSKEQIVYDVNPNPDLELPLLLNFNKTPCFLDMSTQTLKYSIQDTSKTLEVLAEFQAESQVKFNNKPLTNNAINNLGEVTIHKPYLVEIIFEENVDTFFLEFTPFPLVQIIKLDRIKNEPKSLARMLINDNTTNTEVVNTPIGIEWRGSSSLRRPKKAYGFEPLSGMNPAQTQTATFLGMTAGEKWTLDAMYVDRARGRNKLCFELWNSLNDPMQNKHKSVEGKLVELFVNNQSMGLYCLSKKFTSPTLQADGLLYEGRDNTPHTEFQEVPKGQTNKSHWGHWQQSDLNKNTGVEWESFESFLRLVVEGTDAAFVSNIDQHLDLDIAIDYYLFINLINGSDNVGKNWFFYQESQQSPFLILPWDMDATCGRNHDGSALWYTTVITNGLFDRLLTLNPNNYRQKLKQRWNALRSQQFSNQNLESMLHKHFQQLHHYQLLETERRKWDSTLDWDIEAAYMKNWFNNRLTFLDSYIAGL